MAICTRTFGATTIGTSRFGLAPTTATALLFTSVGVILFGWRIAKPRRLLARCLLDVFQHLEIFRTNQRCGIAEFASTPRSANPVHVVVASPRHIEVEHVADVGDVEAAGCNVTGCQEQNLARAEAIERRHARALIHIAVQRASIEAVLGQRLEQDCNVTLAITENDRVAHRFAADQIAQDLTLGKILAIGAEPEPLGDRLCRCGRRRHFDALRVGQELIDKARDLRRHRCREKQRLALWRQQLADLFDVRDEAHVEHPVGLVDNEDLDAHQHQTAALKMIEHAAGGGNQNVGTAVEFLDLLVHRYAADQQRDVEFVIDTVFLEALRHLGCKLTGWRQDQRARHASTRATTFKSRDHRQHERRRLAGTGLGDAEYIPARHSNGDGLALDRRGDRVSGSIDGCLDLGAETELSEGLRLQKGSSPSPITMHDGHARIA